MSNSFYAKNHLILKIIYLEYGEKLMEAFMNFEFYILNLISNISSPVMDKLMIFVSATGNAGILWIVLSVILAITKKYRKCGFTMMISLLLCLIFGNLILKPLIARPRPFWVDDTIKLLIKAPTDFSFPSGHTFSSFSSAFAVLFMKNKSGFEKKISTVFLIYAFLIAFSRLYLKVHFPSDVLCGFLLGILNGYVSQKIINLLYKKFNKNIQI